MREVYLWKSTESDKCSMELAKVIVNLGTPILGSVRAPAGGVNLYVLPRIQVDHPLTAEVYRLQRPLPVELERRVGAPLTGAAPLHPVWSVNTAVAEDAKLEWDARLDLAPEPVAAAPPASASAPAADLVPANEHGGELLHNLGVRAARVGRVHLFRDR